MEETSVGLPNTCSQCGSPQAGTWYAENDDMALSGQGLCPACTGISDEAEGDEPSNTVAYADLTVEQVKAAVEDGTLTAAEALKREGEGEGRVTLLRWLEGRKAD